MEFTLKTKIKAAAKEIYISWLSSEGHSKMTGGEARISDKIEDSFTAWDGYIEGKNIALEPYKRILQSWRTSQFEEKEKDSQIEILLNEVDGHTELTLIHTNVPESGEHYRKGWEDHYFQPMQIYFST
jgi:activator of HSP90 ATPase